MLSSPLSVHSVVVCLCLYSAERGQILCFGVWWYYNATALPPQVRLSSHSSESPECICIFHSAESPSCTALVCQHGFSLKCHYFKSCPTELLRCISVAVNVSQCFTVALRYCHNNWYWWDLILESFQHHLAISFLYTATFKSLQGPLYIFEWLFKLLGW